VTPRVARVAVPALGRGGDRLLDYAVPPVLAERIAVGMVVRVPVREREARGLVLELADEPAPGLSPERLRPVRRLEDAAVPADLVALVPWLSAATLTTLAAAAAVLVPPPAAAAAPALVWRGPLGARATAAERRIAALLAEGPRARAELVALGASPAALTRLRRGGGVVEVGADDPGLATPCGGDAPATIAVAPGPGLNAEQRRAAQAAVAAGEMGGGAFLLVGPTGSGKTEVYLEVIGAALARGRGAIVLVPEIALTPQTTARFERRFGPAVAVLHSALGQRERAAAWRRLARGEARVAVGPRSAVWAPVADLGVVVVDEEPEASYRGERAPRYDARSVALERGRRAGATVLFGSATPSLEALAAAARGDLRRIELTRRAGGRALPPVEVVDLRRERARPAGVGGLITAPLAAALRDTAVRGEQAVLLLNRRGYHPVCVCRDCGHTLTCSACDVSLTVHADRGLLCHYCGRASALPALCPRCGGPRLGGLGAGTQRLVDEVSRLLPGARVLRLDRDSAARRGESERLVAAFADGAADILVGTQMVAKGHDLPGVTLVGVVLADQGLRYPDFRAAERTAQLLIQAAGRAGRGERGGRVILQSYDPEHAVVRAAVDHDYLGFAREELERRRELGYPPFGALALATVAGVREERVEEAAARIARAAADATGVRVLGPAPPPVPRRDGRHLRQVLGRAIDARAARDAAERMLATEPLPGVRLDVALDPA
jgi:primosomal protein N' (replication factor Y)